jgi:hypothetical protein
VTSSCTTTALRESTSRPRLPDAAIRPDSAPDQQQAEREPEAQPAVEELARDADMVAVLVAQTVAGLQRSSNSAVTASTLKRALLRKDPTFRESDYGFRTFGELLRHLAERNVVELAAGPAKGDPEVSLPEHGDREEAFGLLRSVVQDLTGGDGAVTVAFCSSARPPPQAARSNCGGALRRMTVCSRPAPWPRNRHLVPPDNRHVGPWHRSQRAETTWAWFRTCLSRPDSAVLVPPSVSCGRIGADAVVVPAACPAALGARVDGVQVRWTAGARGSYGSCCPVERPAEELDSQLGHQDSQ